LWAWRIEKFEKNEKIFDINKISSFLYFREVLTEEVNKRQRDDDGTV